MSDPSDPTLLGELGVQIVIVAALPDSATDGQRKTFLHIESDPETRFQRAREHQYGPKPIIDAEGIEKNIEPDVGGIDTKPI